MPAAKSVADPRSRILARNLYSGNLSHYDIEHSYAKAPYLANERFFSGNCSINTDASYLRLLENPAFFGTSTDALVTHETSIY